MVNGKQKGSAFERKIANYLSDKFKHHTNKDKSFSRNPDSGSFMGGKNQNRIETHDEGRQAFGDILTPSSFKYVVECKNYKAAPSLNAILEGKVGEWDEWIGQVEQDAVNANRSPLLIIKYNYTSIFTMSKHVHSTRNPVFVYKEWTAYNLDDYFMGDIDCYFDEVCDE